MLLRAFLSLHITICNQNFHLGSSKICNFLLFHFEPSHFESLISKDRNKCTTTEHYQLLNDIENHFSHPDSLWNSNHSWALEYNLTSSTTVNIGFPFSIIRNRNFQNWSQKWFGKLERETKLTIVLIILYIMLYDTMFGN